MAHISQKTFSNVFSSMKMFEFRLKCHWSLFLRVQLTKFQHCSGDKPLYEAMLVSLLTHKCVTGPQWVMIYDLIDCVIFMSRNLPVCKILIMICYVIIGTLALGPSSMPITAPWHNTLIESILSVLCGSLVLFIIRQKCTALRQHIQWSHFRVYLVDQHSVALTTIRFCHLILRLPRTLLHCEFCSSAPGIVIIRDPGGPSARSYYPHLMSLCSQQSHIPRCWVLFPPKSVK